MRITDLEDNLRAHIWARIHRGELTGSGLSRDAGFQQAHMSNFLNARRGLSPEAMERLLDVLGVDILDLADPEELRLRALHRLKPDTIGDRSAWLRFVLVRADPGSVRAMMPRLAPGAMLLLDRHFNSLRPYHRGMRNIYAVRVGEQYAIRYVAVGSGRVILRPHNDHWPVELVEIGLGRGFAEYIVGRVCHVAVEV